MTVQLDNFDLGRIADSGQCFRMNPLTKDTYRVIAMDRLLDITDLGGGSFDFACKDEDFENIWRDYFDLSVDYGQYISSIPKSDEYLSRAAAYGSGIRILKQEPFETLITFIISQRKNIPAIKSSVEKLCRLCGKKIETQTKEEIFSFPTPELIADLSPDELSSCSLGYRASYVHDAAAAVRDGAFDMQSSRLLSDDELFGALLNLRGVGKKVANCVMLFAYHRIAVFPIDVWIQRILDSHYSGSFPIENYRGFAGVMQQYLFFYARSTNTRPH